jgi:hypothetical protein
MKIYTLVIFNSSRSKAAFWDTPTKRLQKQESGASPVINRFFERLKQVDATGVRFIYGNANLSKEAVRFCAESVDDFSLYKILVPLVRQLGLTLVHLDENWMIQHDRILGCRIFPASMRSTFEAYDPEHGASLTDKAVIRKFVSSGLENLLAPLGFALKKSEEHEVSFERSSSQAHFQCTFNFAGRSHSQWFSLVFRVRLKPVMDYYSLAFQRSYPEISKTEASLSLGLKSLRWHVEPAWHAESFETLESCRNIEEAHWMLNDFERLIIPIINQCANLRGLYDLYCDQDIASRCYENLHVQSTSTYRAMQIAWQLGSEELERAAELVRERSRNEEPHPRVKLQDIDKEIVRLKQYLIPTGAQDFLIYPDHS